MSGIDLDVGIRSRAKKERVWEDQVRGRREEEGGRADLHEPLFHYGLAYRTRWSWGSVGIYPQALQTERQWLRLGGDVRHQQ